jgi:hypothetical protein
MTIPHFSPPLPGQAAVPPLPSNQKGEAYNILDLDNDALAKELGLEGMKPGAPDGGTLGDGITEGGTIATQPRDESGRFIPKDTVLADTTLTKETETVKSLDSVPEADPKPTEAKEEPAKAPLTKFQAFDKEGELTIPPDLTLTYKADGKLHENVPLEKVVHLAQQNVYNARQVTVLQETAQQAQQAQEAAVTQFKQLEQYVERLLSDDDFSAAAKQLFAQANSPEQRAARAEQSAQQAQQQMQDFQEGHQVASFTAGTIEPAVQNILKEYPTLDQDDVLGRLALHLPQFHVNGKVPLANLPKVQHYVETDLSQWAKSVHEKRSGAIAAARAATTAQQADLATQKAATQAKQRQLGRAMAPVGNAAPPAQKSSGPIKKAADIFNDPLFGGSGTP